MYRLLTRKLLNGCSTLNLTLLWMGVWNRDVTSKLNYFVSLQEKTTVLPNLHLLENFASISQINQEVVSLVKRLPELCSE